MPPACNMWHSCTTTTQAHAKKIRKTNKRHRQFTFFLRTWGLQEMTPSHRLTCDLHAQQHKHLQKMFGNEQTELTSSSFPRGLREMPHTFNMRPTCTTTQAYAEQLWKWTHRHRQVRVFLSAQGLREMPPACNMWSTCTTTQAHAKRVMEINRQPKQA